MHNLLRDLAAEQGLNVEGVPRMPSWKEVRPLIPVILRPSLVARARRAWKKSPKVSARASGCPILPSTT